MQAILWKIISAIMSAIFFITGLIPGISLNEPKPVEDIRVFDDIHQSSLSEEDYRIFYSYDEWNGYFEETVYNKQRDEFIS
jgi:hypothetical protein